MKFNRSKNKTFNYILTLTLTTILILSLALTAFAQTGKITGSVVNIRSGPSTNNEIVGTLYQDTEVTILDKQKDWYKISFGPVSGWVAASLLGVEAEKTIQVTGNLVNLRSGPATSTAIVTKVSQGTILTLLDIEGEWYKVRTSNGEVGYIAAYLTKAVTTEHETPPVVTPPSTTTPPVTTPPANTGTNNTGAPVVCLDSNKLNFEVAPIIENGRTLVPLRAIFEAMGATVDWNDATKTVIATKGNTSVVLTIGSTQPTVNGSVWPLDVPAKIVQDRTMAPLRFVGEAFGGKVDWNEATRTISMTSPINNVDNGKKPTAVIVSNTVNLRTGPDTTYSSIDQAQPGEKLAVLDQKNGWYQVSRGGIPSWVAGWVVDVAWETNEPIPEPEPEPKPVETPQPKPEEIKEDVIKLSYTKDETGITLKMTSGSKLNPEIEKTASGLTYTYKDMQIEGLNLIKQDIGSNQLRMRGINSGNDAIISVEIPAGVEFRTETLDKGKTEAIIIPNFILNVERRAFGSTGERLVVTTMSPVEYTKTQQGDKVILEFKDLLLGKARNQYSFNSSLIKETTLKEVSGNTPSVIMTIDTNELGQSSAGLGSDGALNIMLRGKSETRQVRENLIVIDPGHGGKDTGARGSTINEKDVTLDISLQVGNLLKQKGYNVEYIRTDDTYIAPEERPIIANQINPEIFVSIHINSATINTPMGIETYYYAPESNPDLFLQKEDRERLAKSVQTKLISKLQRPNRGVKSGNYGVLRNTNMPSILTEIMFINNPTEEELLKQSHIRTLAAEAIAEGIDEYMRGR